MKYIIFTDLDDTLFSTRDVGEPATVDKSNEYHSFCSEKKMALITLLRKSGANFIPVTGRCTEALNRCVLPELINREYSIVSHGMLILDSDDNVIESWLSHLNSNYDLKLWAKNLSRLKLKLIDDLSDIINLLDIKLIIDHDIKSHITVKLKKENYDFHVLKRLSLYFNNKEFDKFLVHENGRTFSLLPPYCSKSLAVRHLSKIITDDSDLTISIGDSLTDLDFMINADYVMIPQGTQLSRSLYA
ncbi:hypothetical protein BTO01_08465 [Vibrio jasicida]|uniref:HAD family hydrolase n=1 Tax=Vibrio jasicida TaxID=766224 RepID=UPI000CF4EFD7|nr:HAD hydrolase family protein [Vibrio jasicida]PQJ71309.1 hypothetical protein BTO01_08465 [Vibrio jasicida]